jgi:BirA family biotin operon repressor/biotin-[acetyl-CoA-carboxylase] ligase
VPRPSTDLTRPPLSEAELARALVTTGSLWTDVRVLPETGSTNADVMAAALAGAPEGLVIVAERQSSGRGRLDRRWTAPAHAALTFSVLLRPAGLRVSWLPLLAGVAVAGAVARVAGVDAALKWPNDLLVRAPGTDPAGSAGFGKCAGILAEAGPDGVVLGIGLNVSQRADELPEPADPAAFRPTSLALAGAAQLDRSPVLVAVLGALADAYQDYRAAGGDPVASGLADAYRARCATLGQEVSVSLPGGVSVRGRACDVDTDGRLVLATPEGTHALAAGDVHHVRPA